MVGSRLCSIILALAVLFMAGCPTIWKKEAAKTDPPAKELFEQAEDKFQKKRFPEAIQAYERLKSAHPDFEKMPHVYERIADAFLEDNKYEEAVARYRQFLDLYPNHKDRARARYMIAMTFFNQIKGTDLDDSMLRGAETSFKAVLDDTTAGEWKKKAEDKYRECRKKLGEHELYKARTYLNIKRYQAARLSAQRVLDDYPKLGLDKEATALIERTKGK